MGQLFTIVKLVNSTVIFWSLNIDTLFKHLPEGCYKSHAVIYTSIIDAKSLVQHTKAFYTGQPWTHSVFAKVINHIFDFDFFSLAFSWNGMKRVTFVCSMILTKS